MQIAQSTHSGCTEPLSSGILSLNNPCKAAALAEKAIMATKQKPSGCAFTAALAAHIEAMTRPGFYPEPLAAVEE